MTEKCKSFIISLSQDQNKQGYEKLSVMKTLFKIFLQEVIILEKQISLNVGSLILKILLTVTKVFFVYHSEVKILYCKRRETYFVKQRILTVIKVVVKRPIDLYTVFKFNKGLEYDKNIISSLF